MKTPQGLTVYEVNTVSGSVQEAVYERGAIFISSGPTSSETRENFLLKENPYCKYFTALNMKNAVRKSKKVAPFNERVKI